MKMPMSFPDVLEARPDIFHHVGVLMADIARHKNRNLITVAGLPV
jgi:hypothetical protein